MRLLPLKTLSSRIKFAIIAIVVVMTVLFVGYFTAHNRRTIKQYEQASESSSIGIITELKRAERTSIVVSVAMGAVMLLLGILTAIVFSRRITRPLKALDEAKYELISNVSHELRTPLAIISNIISNALVGVTGDLDDKLRQNLETCHANAMRLSHIIDGLLEIAAVDRDKIQMERKMWDLSQVMKEVSLQFEEEAKAKGLKLGLELPDKPIEAYIDRDVIKEVIANLVSNAIRFTAKGSVSMSAAAKGGMVEIAVSDTGVGIARDEQVSVFDSFHQVGRTYGPGEKGVGLGLAISRRFVECHCGSISVTSSPGKGSRFAFVIPVRP